MISGSQFRLYLNCIQTISISARLLHNLGMQPVKLDGCRSGGLNVTAETLGSCLSLKKTPCSSQHMPTHIWYNPSEYLGVPVHWVNHRVHWSIHSFITCLVRDVKRVSVLSLYSPFLSTWNVCRCLQLVTE